jgi:hypothetical protein
MRLCNNVRKVGYGLCVLCLWEGYGLAEMLFFDTRFSVQSFLDQYVFSFVSIPIFIIEIICDIIAIIHSRTRKGGSKAVLTYLTSLRLQLAQWTLMNIQSSFVRS